MTILSVKCNLFKFKKIYKFCSSKSQCTQILGRIHLMEKRNDNIFLIIPLKSVYDTMIILIASKVIFLTLKNCLNLWATWDVLWKYHYLN